MCSINVFILVWLNLFAIWKIQNLLSLYHWKYLKIISHESFIYLFYPQHVKNKPSYKEKSWINSSISKVQMFRNNTLLFEYFPSFRYFHIIINAVFCMWPSLFKFFCLHFFNSFYNMSGLFIPNFFFFHVLLYAIQLLHFVSEYLFVFFFFFKQHFQEFISFCVKITHSSIWDRLRLFWVSIWLGSSYTFSSDNAATVFLFHCFDFLC